jgi:hypothetical protein
LELCKKNLAEKVKNCKVKKSQGLATPNRVHFSGTSYQEHVDVQRLWNDVPAAEQLQRVNAFTRQQAAEIPFRLSS